MRTRGIIFRVHCTNIDVVSHCGTLFDAANRKTKDWPWNNRRPIYLYLLLTKKAELKKKTERERERELHTSISIQDFYSSYVLFWYGSFTTLVITQPLHPYCNIGLPLNVPIKDSAREVNTASSDYSFVRGKKNKWRENIVAICYAHWLLLTTVYFCLSHRVRTGMSA